MPFEIDDPVTLKWYTLQHPCHWHLQLEYTNDSYSAKVWCSAYPIISFVSFHSCLISSQFTSEGCRYALPPNHRLFVLSSFHDIITVHEWGLSLRAACSSGFQHWNEGDFKKPTFIPKWKSVANAAGERSQRRRPWTRQWQLGIAKYGLCLFYWLELWQTFISYVSKYSKFMLCFCFCFFLFLLFCFVCFFFCFFC